MSETEVLQPTAELLSDDETLVAATPISNRQATAATLDSALDRRLLKRYDIHQPSPDSDVKEVHYDGLQPYQITRKSLRPGRPMTTISSLPSGEIVAGTKAGRRESHIFAGNPSRGTTVWLPVVASDGAWNFNANDRALRWREMKAASTLRVIQLVDAITTELLVEYYATTTGAALHFYTELENSLELLVMASILAITEPRRAKDGRSGSRDRFLGSAQSSPESSRSPSPHPYILEHENLSCDLAVTQKLADFARKLRKTDEEEREAKL